MCSFAAKFRPIRACEARCFFVTVLRMNVDEFPAPNLNIRQARFISAYIELSDPAAAAIQAGYSSKGALQTGRRLLKNGHINKSLQVASARAVDKVSTTLGEAVGTESWIVDQLVTIIKDEGTQQRDRIASLSLLSKRIAAFRDPSVVIQNQSLSIPPDTSLEDLRQLASEMRSQLPPDDGEGDG